MAEVARVSGECLRELSDDELSVLCARVLPFETSDAFQQRAGLLSTRTRAHRVVAGDLEGVWGGFFVVISSSRSARAQKLADMRRYSTRLRAPTQRCSGRASPLVMPVVLVRAPEAEPQLLKLEADATASASSRYGLGTYSTLDDGTLNSCVLPEVCTGPCNTHACCPGREERQAIEALSRWPNIRDREFLTCSCSPLLRSN